MEVLQPVPVGSLDRQTAMAIYGPAYVADPSRFDLQIPTPAQKMTYRKTTIVNADVQRLKTELANAQKKLLALTKIGGAKKVKAKVKTPKVKASVSLETAKPENFISQLAKDLVAPAEYVPVGSFKQDPVPYVAAIGLGVVAITAMMRK